MRAGDFSGALDAFKQSLKINPRLAAPWIGLAQVLERNGQFEDARACLERAAAAEPDHLDARLKLAMACKNLGHVEAARQQYDRALAIDAGAASVHVGIGQLMEDLGDPEAAAAAYRTAIELDATRHQAMANLLGLSRHVDVSREMETATETLRRAGDREKALIGYGLGKAHEQQKNYDLAFEAYAAANAARRAEAGAFDRDVFDRRIDKMLTIFSRDFFDARNTWGIDSARPVFIVGLPRSGTTLTEQVIGSHPECFGAGELFALTDLATATPDRLGNKDTHWPFAAPDLTGKHVRALAADYLVQSSTRAPASVLRVVDKQPLNFWHLGLVAIALPNAKIIHCTRDIRDCGLSIYSQNFNPQQAWSTDLGDIAHYWRGYRRLMAHWASVTGLQIMDVAYEETVSDLEGQARRLLEFLELEWDPGVLNFHENERAVQTPSRWQVRRPLYQSSKARWRRFEAHLGPLLQAAGPG